MNIAFYNNHPYWGGLADNGGSRTIIRSVKTLQALGHKACIVTDNDRHTWEPHDAPAIKIPKNVDAVIAVSISDLKPMIKETKRWKIKKAIWLRGMETWQMPGPKIYSRLKNFASDGHTILVNSSWLSAKIWKHGIPNQILYQGFDLKYWQDLELRDNETKLKIGCLYNNDHESKRYDLFEKLPKQLGFDKYAYCAFGRHGKRPNPWLEPYLSNPSHKDLVSLYSSCRVWFAPTEKEGLHNVPAEANLCGCLVVHNDMVSNGILDYSGNECAMVYSDDVGAVQMIEGADYSKVPVMQEKIKTKIGDRKQNMERFIKLLQGGKHG